MTYSIRAYNKRQFQDNERGGGGGQPSVLICKRKTSQKTKFGEGSSLRMDKRQQQAHCHACPFL